MSVTAWIFVGVVALFVVELIQGRHRGIHRLQDGYIMAASFAWTTFSRPATAFVTGWVVGMILPQWKGALATAPFWASYLVILVSAEFCQYWYHRWAHDQNRHRLLWGMHRTHHTAPYVNVTLLYRSNICWGVFHPYGWVAAVAVYLGQPAAAATFFLSIMVFNTITHSDWRWDETIMARVPGGRRIVEAWELVFVSPRIHHAHHGYGRDGTPFRNFNTMLSFFDRLFGTLHVPDGRPWRYGVPGGEHHWIAQVLFPLVPLGATNRRDRLNRVVAD